MDIKKAADLVDSQFSFDVVGSGMMKLRKNLENVEIKEKLIEDLYDATVEEYSIEAAEELELIRQACIARVNLYIEASKAGKGKGCS